MRIALTDGDFIVFLCDWTVDCKCSVVDCGGEDGALTDGVLFIDEECKCSTIDCGVEDCFD
jgi:hypothetical protein